MMSKWHQTTCLSDVGCLGCQSWTLDQLWNVVSFFCPRGIVHQIEYCSLLEVFIIYYKQLFQLLLALSKRNPFQMGPLDPYCQDSSYCITQRILYVNFLHFLFGYHDYMTPIVEAYCRVFVFSKEVRFSKKIQYGTLLRAQTRKDFRFSFFGYILKNPSGFVLSRLSLAWTDWHLYY